MAASVIVVMGPPGSGKGTQSKILADKLRGVHYSSGQLIRDANSAKIVVKMLPGGLAQSRDVIELVDKAITTTSPEQVIVLDGFTRKLDEAKWLQERTKQLGRNLKTVIYLRVDQSEATERNIKRGRKDDTLEIQRRRWQVEREETQPVVDYYRQQGLLVEVDGTGSVGDIAKRIEAVV